MIKFHEDLSCLHHAMSANKCLQKRWEIILNDLHNKNLLGTALRSVEAHAPIWHEYPLLIHIEETVHGAKLVRERTSKSGNPVDLTLVMACHDLGKIPMFIEYQNQNVGSDELVYQNHELKSADFTRHYVSSDGKVWYLIRWHGLAYSGIKPENLIKGYGQNLEWLTELLLVWACDAYGKGWVPNQVTQRPKIAEFIQEVVTYAKLPQWVANISRELCLDGMPK